LFGCSWSAAFSLSKPGRQDFFYIPSESVIAGRQAGIHAMTYVFDVCLFQGVFEECSVGRGPALIILAQ
jgi:hypothetical protein